MYRNSDNSRELKDSVHWRRFKELATSFYTLERVDKSEYNFNNICCYTCIGDELQGDNVNYSVSDGYSCFVYDNRYDFFEIPKYSNQKPYAGEYMFIAHNTDFDYWVFGEMKYTIRDNFESTVRLNDRATFVPYGKYNVIVDGRRHSITKTEYGKNVNYGGNQKRNQRFDKLGNRLRAYGTSIQKLLNKRHNTKGIKGGDAVKIYKKRSKRNSNTKKY